MVYGKRKGPSWASGSGRWVVPARGTMSAGKKYYMQKTRALKLGYARRVGYYGRYNKASGVGRELKFHDVDLDDGVIAAGGTITPSINLIAQGVTESARIGRKCVIKKIQWRYRLCLTNSTSGTTDTVRIIMYLDKQANGATAAVTDILETADIHSFNNLVNSGRFRILMDRSVDVLKTSGGDASGTLNHADIHMSGTFFKNCNIPLEFAGTTGAITEIRSNNLGVLLLGKDGVAQFDSKIRLRFQG